MGRRKREMEPEFGVVHESEAKKPRQSRPGTLERRITERKFKAWVELQRGFEGAISMDELRSAFFAGVEVGPQVEREVKSHGA